MALRLPAADPQRSAHLDQQARAAPRPGAGLDERCSSATDTNESSRGTPMKHTSHPLQFTRLAALLLSCFAAHQAQAIVTYAGDPGTLGDPASWRTAEFQSDWGLRSIGAEYAYAAGYSAWASRSGRSIRATLQAIRSLTARATTRSPSTAFRAPGTAATTTATART
jgi:hypothetical protein